MFITKKHLARRTFLRGLGTALALPLLDAMVPALSATQRTAAAGARRLGFVYLPNGVSMNFKGVNYWRPLGEGSTFEFSPILKPLESFRKDMVVVSGLTHRQADVMDDGANGDHTRGTSTWLTGVHPKHTEGADVRNGISADQIAAQQFGRETPLPSLELALEAGASISYLTPQTPLPMETNPRVVFERLLGDGSTPEERAARQRQLSSLLDSVTGQVASLQRGLPAADRERMDRYLTDVRELERRLTLAADSARADLEVPDKPSGTPGDFEEHTALLFDLLALAWAADLTRIATFMVSRELSNRLYPRSGVNEGFHNASHHSGIAGNIDRLAKLNEYHTRATIAYFLGKLADTPDGDGTLLDHSLIVYGSGMANPNQHDHDPLPVLVAGGGSGRLQGGRHLHAGDGTPFANLLVAVLDKLDVPVASFGDSTSVLEI